MSKIVLPFEPQHAAIESLSKRRQDAKDWLRRVSVNLSGDFIPCSPSAGEDVTARLGPVGAARRLPKKPRSPESLDDVRAVIGGKVEAGFPPFRALGFGMGFPIM